MGTYLVSYSQVVPSTHAVAVLNEQLVMALSTLISILVLLLIVYSIHGYGLAVPPRSVLPSRMCCTTWGNPTPVEDHLGSISSTCGGECLRDVTYSAFVVGVSVKENGARNKIVQHGLQKDLHASCGHTSWSSSVWTSFRAQHWLSMGEN